MERLKTGDQAALETLYDNYGAAIYGVVLKIVGTEQEARDVVQASFVKIWKHAASYKPGKGSPFTWMLNIARNTAIDALRKKQKSPSTPNQSATTGVGVHGAELPNTDIVGLKDLVAQLPEEQQTVIEYLYFRGYTQQEAAEALGWPLGTVKTRSRAALQKLRSLFKK